MAGGRLGPVASALSLHLVPELAHLRQPRNAREWMCSAPDEVGPTLLHPDGHGVQGHGQFVLAQPNRQHDFRPTVGQREVEMPFGGEPREPNGCAWAERGKRKPQRRTIIEPYIKARQPKAPRER